MYAVMGVTGNTGGAAARALLEAKLPVRAIVRSQEKGEPWAELGAEVAVADITDSASLAAAFRGADGVYLVRPPAPRAVSAGVPESFAAAVGDSGVANVVMLSSVGAHLAEGTGIIGTLYDMEQALRSTGVARTFIRASYFMQNWAEVIQPAREAGVLPTFLPADFRLPMVSVEDIGRTAAELLQNPAPGERIVNLGGPAEYTSADAARELGSILGRDVQVNEVPREAMAATMQQFGLPEVVAVELAEMYAAVADGRVAWNEEGEARSGSITLGEALGKMAG